MQGLHESGTILCDDVFEQAPQTNAKHFCTCSNSLCVHSWNRKPMHSQYCHLTEKPPVDIKETYSWLKSSNLPAATEKLVVAAQDQALRTWYYKCNILHPDVSPTCQYCRLSRFGFQIPQHIFIAQCMRLKTYTCHLRMCIWSLARRTTATTTTSPPSNNNPNTNQMSPQNRVSILSAYMSASLALVVNSTCLPDLVTIPSLKRDYPGG